MLKELFEQLDHPSSEYRGAPFWSWNGRLDPEELRKQIRVMRDMGMGGFFMHARTGLDTAYLSDEAVCAGLAIETDQVTTSETALDAGPYEITLDEPNVLVLDRARYRFDGGDWTQQGLPFYSGAVSYATTVEHSRTDDEQICLKLGDVDASCAAVTVNGQKAGVAAWAPWEVDITEFLKTGENQLELKLYSHRRNSHGPLYQNDPHPKGTSPNSFMEYNDRYALVSCGLRSAPQIAVRSVTG